MPCSSADAPKVGQLRFLVRQQLHSHGVDPYPLRGDIAGGQPLTGKLAELAHFRVGDRLERGAVAQPSPALDLTEDQRPIPGRQVHRDNVNLAHTTAPIAIENHHALPLELGRGEIFATRTERLSWFPRHRTPPPGTMRI